MAIKDMECSADGCYRKSISLFNGKPYCNKHWLRLHLNGDLELHGKKIKTKYYLYDDHVEGITSSGKRFIFDREDFDKVSAHSWTPSRNGYLVCTYKRKNIRLHRFIVNCNDKNMVVDHINGDIYDNRRSNLRITTQKNNARNAKVSKNNKTGVTGVSLLANGKYKARICVNGKEISLGIFKSFERAVLARKIAEKKYFGDYVRKN